MFEKGKRPWNAVLLLLRRRASTKSLEDPKAVHEGRREERRRDVRVVEGERAREGPPPLSIFSLCRSMHPDLSHVGEQALKAVLQPTHTLQGRKGSSEILVGWEGRGEGPIIELESQDRLRGASARRPSSGPRRLGRGRPARRASEVWRL
jgi:hypothetical protein